MLILVIIIAPAAFAEFLAPNRLFVLLTRLALDSGDGFQFLRRVVPLASDRCTFIEIKLLGVIGPNQIFPGEERDEVPKLSRDLNWCGVGRARNRSLCS